MKRSSKSIALLVVLILLIAMTSIALVSCQADAGLSAYEIACKNGFVGTELEWLETLKGEGGEDGDAKSDNIIVNTALLSVVSIYTQHGNSGNTGSGVIYHDDKSNGDAYIITNYHVVQEAVLRAVGDPIITVYLYGSEVNAKGIAARYVGGSMNHDIAVISIEDSAIYRESKARKCVIGDSHRIAKGDYISVIGNANAEGISLTRGIISQENEQIQVPNADETAIVDLNVMRTDAPINGGNSGGGVFDADGKLIGIAAAKRVAPELEGLGYAIPINTAKLIADKIINKDHGGMSHGIYRNFLGVMTQVTDMTAIYDEELDKIFTKQTITAVEIQTGAANRGGMKAGDIILSVRFQGKLIEIDKDYLITDILLQTAEGDVLEFNVLRNGAEKTLEITMDEQRLVK